MAKQYEYYIPVRYITSNTVKVVMDHEDLDDAIDAMYELDDLDQQALNDPVECDVEVDGRENVEVREVEV